MKLLVWLGDLVRDALLAVPGGGWIVARLVELKQLFGGLDPSRQILALLILVIILFTVVSLLFALGALRAHLLRHRQAIRRTQLEASWTQTLLDALAGEAEMAALWRTVTRRDRLTFLDFLARFARRLDGEELSRLRGAARPWLAPIRRRTRSREPERRARAVRTLADLAPRRHRDLLFAALDDPSPLVSMIGARTLVKMGSAEAVDAVLDRLHRYAAWSDNYLASMFVSAGSAALEPLRKRLASGELPDRSTAVALRTLRLLGDPTAVSPALAALGENASVSTRVAALGVLAKLGSGEHAAAARQAARAPEDAVRSHALSALGRLGGGADVPLLLEGLRDSSPWVARHAADGLVHLGAFDELARFAESGHENALHARQALAEEAA